ncbi:hypothetical protein AB4518_24125, partial [Vibrio sp. 10N.222.54.E8]|uniref:hypothetical protein n=3 Tax=unclassified Vibrio TaxID=2614977 RepID=UPI003552DB83
MLFAKPHMAKQQHSSQKANLISFGITSTLLFLCVSDELILRVSFIRYPYLLIKLFIFILKFILFHVITNQLLL